MNTISLCMIVKNEENVLARCLKSVASLVDEIIIVDTGSTDKTKEIAQKFTSMVYDFKWTDNFSDARNFSFKMASGNYILWLDADDVVPKRTLNFLLNLKPDLCSDVYMLKYDIAFTKNKPTFSYFRERIIKNCPQAIWNGAVHECITPFGKIERLSYSIYHKKETTPKPSNRNLNIYKNLEKTRLLTPRELYYYGRELFEHKRYKKCLTILKKFIESKSAWNENVIDALYLMSVCYKYFKDESNSLNCLFKTFYYDTPRANICCFIGDHFLSIKQYNIATYWYNCALRCENVINKGGFVENKYYNYYPYLQLCCCFFYLGDIKKANKFNELAGKHINSQIVANNRQFFKMRSSNN